jgi:hypothetical protein
MEVPVQEALCPVRREAYPRYELGRLKSLVTLKMEAICFCRRSVLTRAKYPRRRHSSNYNLIEGVNEDDPYPTNDVFLLNNIVTCF